jgi:hypothetical protein
VKTLDKLIYFSRKSEFEAFKIFIESKTANFVRSLTVTDPSKLKDYEFFEENGAEIDFKGIIDEFKKKEPQTQSV